MKFSVSALVALGALASSVQAIDLNPDDVQSIKKAASIAAKGLRKWYTGDRPGDTPGNLPDPYYWWEAGAMFGAFIDYWYYTGDTTYNAITKQALIHQIGDYQAFMPPNQTRTLGNDDQAFWGMAALTAAEDKFPDPAEGEAPSWLSLAQAVFNTQQRRWDNATCGGGLKWQIFPFNNGYNYKNTISNGCFFNIAARLAKYTGNETYSTWAERAWNWERAIGLMSPEYYFYDGTDDRKNCSEVDHHQWTYNAGVHMAGAAAMWNLTQSDPSRERLWRERLAGVIKSIDIFFHREVKDVMVEVACEFNNKCNNDQRSFKAYLSRWMGYTMQVAPWTVGDLMPKLRTSAVAAAKQCNAEGEAQTCGLRWYTNGQNDGSFGPGEQMSAMEVFQNLLIKEVPGPVTLNNGGISKSNPEAGSEEQHLPTNLDDVTTGDKAGAGILTTVVLVGILGGAWWMVS
ncbi:mannan endo-1,6-alpha-mannosidase [Westerdykella ornata]|uniref:Mannan endo-1,6-alpha-mannosidase n=1 Tax=Westerdykella ornata TaxID=318751 RepID=A0A6A6JBI7_WESOR|nr:mannan endo-1,6-alpha-mannosidase [Westerdykella ornata]KAF2273348.1 mannan endo-1,6-alpha-mannosidase [Westerdykella ornata]